MDLQFQRVEHSIYNTNSSPKAVYYNSILLCMCIIAIPCVALVDEQQKSDQLYHNY